MLKDFFDRIPYLGLLTGLPGQRRFDWLMYLNRSVLFKKPEVLGSENLTEIPKSPLVIVASHFSDADLQTVVSELRPRLKRIRPNRSIGLSLQSENLEDPRSVLFIRLAGREHFFEIDAHIDRATNHLKFTFNPENFKKMARALLYRTDIIIAAHEPLSNIPGIPWELPARSGLGAAYLAQMANAVLLPVAVDIQTSQPVGMSADIGGAAKRLVERERPQVKVVIGKPFTLDKISQAELEILGRHISHLRVSQEEEVRAKEAFKKLKAQSDRVMGAIAALLPEEKRGRWKNDNVNDTMVG